MGTTIPEPQRGLTFDDVWAALMEGRKQMEETFRRMDERADRLDKQLGELGNRMGEMVEHLVKPNMLEKFQRLGFVFTKAYADAVIKDENNKFIAQIDITLEDGDKVMLVEVKNKPTTENIAEHVERIKKVRAYADSRNDRRKLMGAIAGVVMSENEKQFAFKNGFYVFEPSGTTFNILVPESPYSPREW